MAERLLEQYGLNTGCSLYPGTEYREREEHAGQLPYAELRYLEKARGSSLFLCCAGHTPTDATPVLGCAGAL